MANFLSNLFSRKEEVSLPIFHADKPDINRDRSAELFEKGLCLPSGSNLSDEDLQRVVNAVLGCFQD
jgi:dTDP-4-amino-4,6-dideoxygalactose transaminase